MKTSWQESNSRQENLKGKEKAGPSFPGAPNQRRDSDQGQRRVVEEAPHSTETLNDQIGHLEHLFGPKK